MNVVLQHFDFGGLYALELVPIQYLGSVSDHLNTVLLVSLEQTGIPPSVILQRVKTENQYTAVLVSPNTKT